MPRLHAVRTSPRRAGRRDVPVGSVALVSSPATLASPRLSERGEHLQPNDQRRDDQPQPAGADRQNDVRGAADLLDVSFDVERLPRTGAAVALFLLWHRSSLPMFGRRDCKMFDFRQYIIADSQPLEQWFSGYSQSFSPP